MTQGANTSPETFDADDRLRYWRDEWLAWDGAAYRVIPDGDLKARMNRFIKEEFDRINLEQLAKFQLKVAQGQVPPAAKPPRSKKVTRDLVSNSLQALASMTLLPAYREPPIWLIPTAPFPAHEVLVARNGLVHLPSLVEGAPCLLRPTPAFFGLNGLRFDFAHDASAPVHPPPTFTAPLPASSKTPSILPAARCTCTSCSSRPVTPPIPSRG